MVSNVCQTCFFMMSVFIIGLSVQVAVAGSSLELQCTSGKSQVLLREQVLLLCHYRSSSRSVIIDYEDLESGSATVIKIPLSKAESVHKKGMFEYRFGWAIFPEKAGKLEFNLPEIRIEFKKQTPDQQKFQFIVNPLPIYLSPLLMVGTTHYREYGLAAGTESGKKSGIEPGTVFKNNWFFQLTGRSYLYRVRLIAIGIPAQWLPNYLEKIKAEPGLTTRLLMTRTKQQVSLSGISSTRDFIYEIRHSKTGFVQLLNFDNRFFDPAQARLMSNPVTAESQLFIASWLLILLSSLLLTSVVIIFYYVFRKLYALFYFMRRLYRQRQQGFGLNDVVQLEKQLRQTMQFYNISSNLTYSDWYRSWVKYYGDTLAFRQLIKQLERTRFSNVDDEKQACINTQVSDYIDYLLSPMVCLMLRVKAGWRNHYLAWWN